MDGADCTRDLRAFIRRHLHTHRGRNLTYAVCKKDQPPGFCGIENYDQLITLARATAAKPMRTPSLAVIVER